MEMKNNISLLEMKGSPFMVDPNPEYIVLLYRYGLSFIFLIGFFGNISSSITYMCPILRITSTGCLFFLLSISDNLYLLITIIELIEVGIIEKAIFLSNYDEICRFRWFFKGLVRFSSAWLLVIIGFDRWFRTRFPFKSNQWCTRRNACILFIIIIIYGICLHSHMLNVQLFGRLFPGMPSAACGPIDPNSFYVYFIFVHWPIIQVCFISIIPALLIIISGIHIYLLIDKEKKRIQPRINNNNNNERIKHNRLQRHMLLLMCSSSILFLSTTLPISIDQIINAYRVAAKIITDINEGIAQEAIFNLLLSFNYAINFYIHCLASQLFRNEFFRCFKIKTRFNQTTIILSNTYGKTRNHPTYPQSNILPMTEIHAN